MSLSVRSIRRLQPFCFLHSCSDCFRPERLTGGTCTPWKSPPITAQGISRRSIEGNTSRGFALESIVDANTCRPIEAALSNAAVQNGAP